MLKFLSSTFLRAPEDEGGAAPNQDALRAALEFDMFAPPADSGTGESEGEGADQDTAQPQGGEASAPPAATPPASPPSASGQAKEGEDDPLAAMRAQVAALLAKTPEKEASPAAPAPAAPAQTEKKEEQAPGYNLTVPDEVVEAFGSEDPKQRKAAIAATINAVSNRLAQDFVQAMKALKEDILREARTQVLTEVDTRSNEAKVREDFYGAFPALKQLVDTNPAFDQAIWQTIAQTAQRTGVKEWNKEFRDSVGAMIHLTLGVPVQVGTPPAKPANGTKPPRKPAFTAGSGPGGGSRTTGDDNDPEGIMAVINAGR